MVTAVVGRAVWALVGLVVVACTAPAARAAAAANGTKSDDAGGSFYDEELYVQPLDNSLVLSVFNFALVARPGAAADDGLRLHQVGKGFPRAYARLFERQQVWDDAETPISGAAALPSLERLEFSLSGGRWQHARWGQPKSRLHFPYGARVVATFAVPASAAPAAPVIATASDAAAAAAGARSAAALPGLKAQWDHLISELAGLFCASLSQMALEEAVVAWVADDDVGGEIAAGEGASREQQEQRHRRSADTAGELPPTTATRLVRVEAVLSRERVCTENLTPFVKLMPCRNRAGLGQLANPLALFRGPYHAISVDLRREEGGDADNNSITIKDANDGAQRLLAVDQAIVSVMLNDFHGGSGAEGDGDDGLASRTVPLATVLSSRGPWRACPAARSSTLLLESPPWATEGTAEDGAARRGPVQAEPLAAVDSAELSYRHRPPGFRAPLWASSSSPSSSSSSTAGVDLDLHRFASPLSKERGTMSTRLRNAVAGGAGGGGSGATVVVNLHEAFPWTLKVYLHTYRALLDGKPLDLSPAAGVAEMTSGGDGSPAAPPLFLSRGRAPTVVVLRNVSLPPGSTLQLSVDYEARFLKLDDFPPDPNYGFDMPPARVEIVDVLDAGGGSTSRPAAEALAPARAGRVVARLDAPPTPSNPVLLYSEGVLLDFPLPDFSMPFNVLCLSATVVAMSFSSIFRIIAPVPLARPTAAAAADASEASEASEVGGGASAATKTTVSRGRRALKKLVLLGAAAAVMFFVVWPAVDPKGHEDRVRQLQAFAASVLG